MNPQTVTASRQNSYPGACSVCSTHVRPFAGSLLGSKRDGYQIRCAPHTPVTPPASDASKPNAPATPPAASKPTTLASDAPRPAVSALAFDAACAMLRASEGNPEARAIMGEIVEAIAWIRGEDWRSIANGVAASSGETPRAVATYRDAADDLVSSILGSRSGDAPAVAPVDENDEQREAWIEREDAARRDAADDAGERIAIVSGPSNTLANALARDGALPIAIQHARKPAASKRASKASAGNPFAHRIKP